jgi:hypothetical protein
MKQTILGIVDENAGGDVHGVTKAHLVTIASNCRFDVVSPDV